MKRVYWTSNEEYQVYSQVPELMTERWPTMLARIQQVLPPDRRKNLHYSSQSTNVKQRYFEWLKEQKHFTPPKGSLLGTPETPAMESMYKEAVPVNNEPELIIIERVVKTEPDYLSIPTSTLLRILGERVQLMEQFEHRFRQMEDMIEAKKLAERSHDVRLGPAPTVEAPKERAIRIVIVGPLDSQAREIEERTANTPKPVLLRFYDKDHQSPRPVGIVDYAIITRHCNHAWWDKVKAVLPADRVFFVDSGIQSVVQKVYDIAARRDA